MSGAATIVKSGEIGFRVEQYIDFTGLDQYTTTFRDNDNAYVVSQGLFGCQFGFIIDDSAELLPLRSGSTDIMMLDEEDLSSVQRLILWKDYSCEVQNYAVDISGRLKEFFTSQKNWIKARALRNTTDITVDRALTGKTALDDMLTATCQPENIQVLFAENSSISVSFSWFLSGTGIIENERVYSFTYTKGNLL